MGRKEQWGTVLEFTPTQKLSYSLFAPRPGLEDKPENYFEMIYSLTSENGQQSSQHKKTTDQTQFKKTSKVKKTRF
jgi:hypothetical protein